MPCSAFKEQFQHRKNPVFFKWQIEAQRSLMQFFPKEKEMREQRLTVTDSYLTKLFKQLILPSVALTEFSCFDMERLLTTDSFYTRNTFSQVDIRV